MKVTLHFYIVLIFFLQSLNGQKISIKIGLGLNYSTFTLTSFGQYNQPLPDINNFYYKLFPQGEVLIGFALNNRMKCYTGINWMRKGTGRGTYDISGNYIDNAPWVDVLGFPVKFEFKPLINKPVFFISGITLGHMYTERSEYHSDVPSVISNAILHKIVTSNYFNEFSLELGLGVHLFKRFSVSLTWSQSMIPIATINTFGTIAIPYPDFWPNEIQIWNTSFGFKLYYSIL